jgi:hypothetical protein
VDLDFDDCRSMLKSPSMYFSLCSDAYLAIIPSRHVSWTLSAFKIKIGDIKWFDLDTHRLDVLRSQI